jgi:hypothetical protein
MQLNIFSFILIFSFVWNFTPKYNGWLKTPQKFKGSRVLQILTWQETTSSSQHPHLLNTFFGFTLIPRHLLTILLTNIEIKRWGSARIKHSNIALILVHLPIHKRPLFCTVCLGWWRLLCAHHAREECNKYDLSAAPCFWLVNHNDWSRWFAISSLSHLFAAPVLSFLGRGCKKKYITKLGCQKCFLQGHILSSNCWGWFSRYHLTHLGSVLHDFFNCFFWVHV